MYEPTEARAIEHDLHTRLARQPLHRHIGSAVCGVLMTVAVLGGVVIGYSEQVEPTVLPTITVSAARVS